MKRIHVADRVLGRTGISRRMRETSRAVAEALFTTREGPPPPDRLDWLTDELDDFLAQAGPRAKIAYALCLGGISTVAPLLVYRPMPYRKLSREQRSIALERLEKGPLGLAVFGAKAILCILYYEHPDAEQTIGYGHECKTPAVAYTQSSTAIEAE
jgi:hypothetical protein